MNSRISDILRFDIPDARNGFREYVFELLLKQELSTNVLSIVLNSMVDISVGIKKDHDERLISEIDYWENVRKLFQDVDFISVSIFHRAKEFLIFPFTPKTMEF